MLATIIQIIIVLLVVGFLYWAVTLLVDLIPGPPLIKQLIRVLLIILIVALILFYVVIPLLHLLAGVNLSVGALYR